MTDACFDVWFGLLLYYNSGKGNEDRNKHESSSKSTQQSSTQERSRDKKEASTKSSNTERKPGYKTGFFKCYAYVITHYLLVFFISACFFIVGLQQFYEILNITEKSTNRSSRRRSKEHQSSDPSRDILTLDKIRVSGDNFYWW